MFDVYAKTVPKNLLDKFVKVSTKQKVLLELVCLFGILFHFLFKLSVYNFGKKIKSLLLNVLGDNYLNVAY